MAATTLRQLLWRYQWQALELADRQVPLGGKGNGLFHRVYCKHLLELRPRGKVIQRLVKIQREFNEYRNSEEYLQKLCDDYAAKHGGATKSQEES